MGRGKRCFVPRVRDNDESKSKQEKHLESSETKDKDGVMDLLEIRSIGELETFCNNQYRIPEPDLTYENSTESRSSHVPSIS